MELSPGTIFRTIWEMLALPEAEVTMFGDTEARRHFEYFTKPHPRYRIIRNKRWGVGLLELPSSFEEYTAGRRKQALRTNRKRSLEQGLFCDEINPMKHIAEILTIHASASVRQGRGIRPEYTNERLVREYFEGKGAVYGAFTKAKQLVAYSYAPICGDVFVLSRLMGHQDFLESGVMYFLLSEVIRQMIANQKAHVHPRWGMYDTFFGATPGLRYFKERLGFQPFKVRWVWEDVRCKESGIEFTRIS